MNVNIAADGSNSLVNLSRFQIDYFLLFYQVISSLFAEHQSFVSRYPKYNDLDKSRLRHVNNDPLIAFDIVKFLV